MTVSTWKFHATNLIVVWATADSGTNQAALFTLKLHRGDGMSLVAMNWKKGKPPNDFVGFAIEYQEPGGDRFYPLNNRIAFPDSSGGVNEACLSSPQATSAHKVMNAPVSRIDLAQAKLEPGSEPGRLVMNGARFHLSFSGLSKRRDECRVVTCRKG